MSNHQALLQRRELLLLLAGLSITPVNFAEALMPSDDQNTTKNHASNLIQAQQDPGKPGDFDFLQGEWKIAHQRPKANSPGEWDHFEGEATCWSILGGIASIEELRIPARNFSGMGLRLLDSEKKLWSDFGSMLKVVYYSLQASAVAFEMGSALSSQAKKWKEKQYYSVACGTKLQRAPVAGSKPARKMAACPGKPTGLWIGEKSEPYLGLMNKRTCSP